jgi:hypothetical protein
MSFIGGDKVKEINVRSDILFYAFRYALGRSTYAVFDVAEAIIKNIKELPTKDLKLLTEEINEAKDSGRIGMDMDKQEWNKVERACTEELIKRLHAKTQLTTTKQPPKPPQTRKIKDGGLPPEFIKTSF